MVSVERLGTEAAAGRRTQFFGTLKRHGTRLKQNGLQERWLLLIDLIAADSGKTLAKHAWFRDGKWSRNMKTGHRYSFCARVERCLGNQKAPNVSGQIDEGHRLANPNKVLEVAIPAKQKNVESSETGTFKVYHKRAKTPGSKKASFDQNQPIAKRKGNSGTEDSGQSPRLGGQNADPPAVPAKWRNNTARKRRSATISSIFENRREAGSRRVRQWTG